MLSEKIRRNLREIAVALRSGPAARRAVGRRYLFDALRTVVSHVGVHTPDGLIFVPTYDRTIGKSVFVSGQWESQYLRDAIDAAGGSRGVFVDVGANLGTTSIAAARLGYERVIAFEPAPDNYRLLRANVAANDLDDKITCVHAAVSDQGGELRISLSAINSGEHHVGEEGAPVRAVTLDEGLREVGVHPSQVGLLWVDVEGHEARVLDGGVATLAAFPPTVVEYVPGRLGVDADRVAGLLGRWQTLRDLRTGQTVTPERAAVIYRDGGTDLLAC